MSNILPQAQTLVGLLLNLMPSEYQLQSFQALMGLFLEAQGHPLPHHCQVASCPQPMPEPLPLAHPSGDPLRESPPCENLAGRATPGTETSNRGVLKCSCEAGNTRFGWDGTTGSAKTGRCVGVSSSVPAVSKVVP